MKKNIALFAGSFDPFTRGHADIVERSLAIFDEVIIAIGINEQKRTLFSAERRQEQIARYYASRPAIGVITYSGLTVDLVRQTGATALVRGIRSGSDFEYERTLADLNRHLSGVDTFLLCTDTRLSFISSSAVRELISFGRDVSDFLPEGFILD
ncbi:pantetheine-phosphate adenylyltransferase [Porphyromonas gulae]|uniref:pantetheine-phosphate adenylyltransferase n=1 Tax=Porphyromonas gulae TaxID=111105 RepID=UPI0026EA270C|nr:pantetheine-phosphate adenylyltransferase [Porphyromonas gulae]